MKAKNILSDNSGDTQTKTNTVETVQTARTSVTSPLVGSVTAGAKPASPITGTNGTMGTHPAMLSLLRQVAEAGVAPGAIDPKSTSYNLSIEHNLDVSEMEEELIHFLRDGDENHIWNDETYFADTLDPKKGGCTPLRVTKEYYGWREARRQFCKKVEAYLSHVYADEMRREQDEAGIEILPPLPALSMEERALRGKAEAVEFLSDLERLAYYLNSDQGINLSNAISNQFDKECDRQILPSLQPCIHGIQTANAMAAAVFGPDLIPDAQEEDGGNAQYAFITGAIMLRSLSECDGFSNLLEAAAIIAHRKNQTTDTDQTTESKGGTN